MFHGHDPSDEDKGRILRWFHKLDAELTGLLAGEQSPLVLAGVEYLLPLYRETNKYPHLLAQGIKGNPEELKPEELHQRAWPLMEPLFNQERQRALERYGQLANSGQATTDVQQAVQSAGQGRVEVLFVALGEQIWGEYDSKQGRVKIHEQHQAGDYDLLDLAAYSTINNGGVVYALPRQQIPEQGALAALYRY